MADRGPQKAGAYERPARLKGWTYNGSPLISARRRTVRLTPLGAAVVSAAGGAIQGQQRIRWAKYRDRILQDCSGND